MKAIHFINKLAFRTSSVLIQTQTNPTQPNHIQNVPKLRDNPKQRVRGEIWSILETMRAKGSKKNKNKEKTKKGKTSDWKQDMLANVD